MIDLRIIIVSWNNRDTLPRCLSSLEKACEGLDWEVVVVDNASTDGTREWLNESEIPNNESRITNNVNKGFARACNQGIAGFDAKYVLLLNPDTECPAGSLTKFLKEADRNPQAGIFGPKLINEDGTVQTSLRRYPGWKDQVGVMLKLHNFFPNAPSFKRYFAKDRDLNTEASVQQVMGACFLIRREVIERFGGLDERYFAWFEEVDYCKTLKESGGEIRYLPSVEVKHIGGHSFAQASSLKKQRIFNASMIAYFRKWHPGWRAESIALLRNFSLCLAWLAGKIGMAGKGSRNVLKTGSGEWGVGSGKFPFTMIRNFLPWFGFIIFVELISGLTIFNNAWNTTATIIASLVVLVVAYKKPELGLAAMLLELVIGSKGALLQLGGWPGTSLRICLFVSFFIGWMLSWLMGSGDRLNRVKSLIGIFKARWEWIGLAVILAYAALRGLMLHQEFFLQDANAWVYLALIVPVFDIASRNGKELRRLASMALMAGIVWIGFKTLALEYFFGHAFHISPEVYLWVRRTGVGEVTLVTANAFRIFFQSHIYEMVGLIGAVSYLLANGVKDLRSATCAPRPVFDVLLASMLALAISLSRSIWMGTAAGLLILAIVYNKALIKQWKMMLAIVGTGVLSLVLTFGALAFPIPKVDYANLKDVFGSRASTGDPASASRWNLLKGVEAKIKEAPILGSGFGATITYESKDPRILKDYPDGMYTTYAFEWGWFEHWIKFGLFGFLFMIFLVARIAWRAWKSDIDPWLRYAMIATLAGLSVVHIFTPYLNHPLGFGVLMMIEGVGVVYGQRSTDDGK